MRLVVYQWCANWQLTFDGDPTFGMSRVTVITSFVHHKPECTERGGESVGHAVTKHHDCPAGAQRPQATHPKDLALAWRLRDERS